MKICSTVFISALVNPMETHRSRVLVTGAGDQTWSWSDLEPYCYSCSTSTCSLQEVGDPVSGPTDLYWSSLMNFKMK